MADNTAARLDDEQQTNLRGFWQANTMAGLLALAALGFLALLRGSFRKHLGG